MTTAVAGGRTPNKQEVRLDVRVSRELNTMIDDAAALTGVTKSAFVKATLADAAARVRREHATLDLSPDESAWLVELLRRPADEPNPLLLSALAAWGETIESEEDGADAIQHRAATE